MNREEIMGMGERELYAGVFCFLHPELDEREQNRWIAMIEQSFPWLLDLCYQAEEKLDSMGLKEKRGAITLSLHPRRIGLKNPTFRPPDVEEIADLTHNNPVTRAQIVLLTVEGNHE